MPPSRLAATRLLLLAKRGSIVGKIGRVSINRLRYLEKPDSELESVALSTILAVQAQEKARNNYKS